jgi:hypothetical protein
MDPRTDAEFEQAAEIYIRDARELLDAGVDVVRLRAYANHDILATWLLQAFARREKVSRLTKVMRAYNLIKQVRPKTYGLDVSLTWQGVIEIFLTLQDLGCGFLTRNAQDGYEQFFWSVSLATVGRVATHPIHMGALDRVGEMATGNHAHSASRMDQALHVAAAVPAKLRLPSPKAQPAGSIAYHFWVRPNSPVTFSLPSNLTPTEAKRLANFIRTVPFGGMTI